MEGLAAALQAMGLTGPGTTEDELWELGNRDVILEHLLDLADARLDARAAEVGDTDWAMVERLVLVRTIDTLWVEHLTEIEDMRRGIGLRGYAQQDPLNEFRREAFQLYQELRALIRHQLATTIFRVSLTRHEHPNAPVAVGAGGDGAVAAGAANVSSGSSTATATRPAGAAAPGGRTGTGIGPAGSLGSPIAGGLPADPMARALRASNAGGPPLGEAKPGFTPTGERIGRNDACWCGSGKKYKKCHGG